MDRVTTFAIKGDARGSLVALEGGQDLPFEIRRVYYIFGTKPGVVRGRHAHRALRQVLICVSGSCTISLDDGRAKSDISLSAPDVGLYIGPGIWREMSDFSPDAVLLVLASEHYDEGDYIRDYDAFLEYAALAPRMA
jgi:dTDP-4-dehydrorhamnose 3,5-epimerase-like enzyme